MKTTITAIWLTVAAGCLSAAPLSINPQQQLPCNSSDCFILENEGISLPFIAIGGDVVLLDPDGSVSDVARFFNNVVNTGGGTGFSDFVFLFSACCEDPNDSGVPDPSTYSANVTFIPEALPTNGLSVTDFNGNGTLYHFVSFEATPEPVSLALTGAGLALCGLLYRRKRRNR